MKNFFEEFKKYLANTPHEQVLADWEESEELDEFGPTFEEYIAHSQQYEIFTKPHSIEILEDLDPEYSSGLLFNICLN